MFFWVGEEVGTCPDWIKKENLRFCKIPANSDSLIPCMLFFSGTNNHAGNIKFRKMVNDHKMRYLSCSKVDKPKVAREVVQLWRQLSPPGRFLAPSSSATKGNGSKKDDESAIVWVEVGDKRANAKASQCLRERTPEVMPYLKQLREQQDATTEQGLLLMRQQHQQQQQQQQVQAQQSSSSHSSPTEHQYISPPGHQTRMGLTMAALQQHQQAQQAGMMMSPNTFAGLSPSLASISPGLTPSSLTPSPQHNMLHLQQQLQQQQQQAALGGLPMAPQLAMDTATPSPNNNNHNTAQPMMGSNAPMIGNALAQQQQQLMYSNPNQNPMLLMNHANLHNSNMGDMTDMEYEQSMMMMQQKLQMQQLQLQRMQQQRAMQQAALARQQEELFQMSPMPNVKGGVNGTASSVGGAAGVVPGPPLVDGSMRHPPAFADQTHTRHSDGVPGQQPDTKREIPSVTTTTNLSAGLSPKIPSPKRPTRTDGATRRGGRKPGNTTPKTSKRKKGAVKRSISGRKVPERTHSGFMSIGSDDPNATSELTLEEYRQQLEKYIATNHDVAIGNNPTDGTADGGRRLGRLKKDDSDSDLEDDWEQEKLKAQQEVSKGVNRTKSGMSMMSTDSRSQMSIFSNLSDISPVGEDNDKNAETAGNKFSPYKRTGVGRTISGISMMSELTDLSQNMDVLSIHDHDGDDGDIHAE